MIGRASLSFDELVTILTEIEAEINSRPLTYVYDDSEGITYPLTPSQLVNGRDVNLSPNYAYSDIVSTQETLTRRSKYHRKILTEFAKKWKNEYLPSFREIANRNKDKETALSIGELVIVNNEQTKRSFWKIGKIIELFPSKDGKVRSVKLKVATDNGTTILVRPLQYLVPLEIEACEETCTVEQSRNEENIDHAATTRPRRTAALIGELVRQDRLSNN